MNKIKHLFNLSRVLLSYTLKYDYCRHMPLKLWVETTSRCNLKCGVCLNKDIPVSQKGDMDMDLYKKIIDEAEGNIYDINLFHRGEPLLHPDIVNMVSYAKSKKIKTRIHTNATLLDRELAGALILSGLDMISFSFDGFTKDIYEKNRTGASYEKSLENIIGFLRIKKELGMRKPFTAVQVIEYNIPAKEELSAGYKDEFLKNFEGLPLNRLVTRTPHNWGGLVDLEVPDKESAGRIKRTSCTFPWYCLTVLYDGKVCLCPQDFKGNIQVGNMTEGTIKQIFNSRKIREMRKIQCTGNIAGTEPCSGCDRINRKTFMGIPKEYISSFLRDNSGN